MANIKEKYLKSLLKTDKFNPDNQDYLKRRALSTFESLIDFIGVELTGQPKKFLDLGSGNGSLVKVASEQGYEAVGLDITDGIDFESDSFPLESGYFDVVTAVSVIEHITNPAIFLEQIYRVLKPNGVFILVTPNWKYSYKVFYNDPTHVHPYTPKSLDFLLNLSGFKRINILPWLVCKPQWMWKVRASFLLARMIPFSG